MSEQIHVQWTADTILDFLHDHTDELCAMGLVKIGVFGSYMRAEQKPDSDIDFLFTEENPTWLLVKLI
jgi:predicted nucleotidyltransferase